MQNKGRKQVHLHGQKHRGQISEHHQSKHTACFKFQREWMQSHKQFMERRNLGEEKQKYAGRVNKVKETGSQQNLGFIL